MLLSDKSPSEGVTVRLQCQIEEYGHPNETNEYIWMKDERILINENKQNLTLKKVTSKDEGQYECLVKNVALTDYNENKISYNFRLRRK